MEHCIGREKGGNLCLIDLQLMKGGPNVRVFIGGILQLDDCERQAVHKNDDIGTPRMVAFKNRELADGELVVVVRHVKVDDPVPALLQSTHLSDDIRRSVRPQAFDEQHSSAQSKKEPQTE